MEEEARSALESLAEVVGGEEGGGDEGKRKCKDAAKDLTLILNEAPQNQFDRIASWIVEGEKGLIVLLEQALHHPSLDSVRLFQSPISSKLELASLKYRVESRMKEGIGGMFESLALALERGSPTFFQRHAPSAQKLALRAAQTQKLLSNRKPAFLLLGVIVKRVRETEIEIGGIVRVCKSEADDSKVTDGVKNMIYQLVGAMAQHLPTKMTPHAQFFAKIVLSDLQKEIGNELRGQSNQIIEGCLVAINGMLVHFHQIMKTQRIKFEKVFGFMKAVLNPQNGLTRFDPVRAAISLLTQHMHLFSSVVLAEYRIVYEFLSFWALKSDRTLKHGALSCIDIFMEEISMNSADLASEDSLITKRLVEFFTTRFSRRIEEERETRSIANAVKGMGYFAAAQKALHGASSALDLLENIVNRSIPLYFGNQDESLEDRISFVPQFLESFARILKVVDFAPQETVKSILSLHVLYLQHFPRLDTKYHARAVLVTYWLCMAASPHFPEYSQQMVQNLLIHICSFPPVTTDSGPDEKDSASGTVSKISVEDFQPFWALLFNPNPNSDSKTLKLFTPDECVHAAKELADSLMQALLDITSKLSFDLVDEREASADLPSTDPLASLKARHIQDFWVFINLAHHFCKILPLVPSHSFSPWVSRLISDFVRYASEHPFVSGFNKILAAILTRTNLESYWDSLESDVIKKATIKTIKSYAQEILPRMTRFQGDLLINCIHLILAFPPAVAESEIELISTSMKTALKQGLSFIPLAENCLSALEFWTENLSQEASNCLFQTVLPSLDSYLMTDKSQDNDVQSYGEQKKRSSKKRKINLLAGKSLLNLKDVSEISEHQSKLQKIKRRIVLLLGRIGDRRQHLMAVPTRSLIREKAAWDTVRHLKYAVPFPDIKPEIDLDSLLPRVCELATETTDRQKKITACELLHASVIFVLGTHSSRSGPEAEGKPLDKLYEKLFPVMIRLSCDGDEVPRQMFRPLMNQIIHWFTSSQTSENPETMCLLQAIWDTLIDPEAAADVKDFAGSCLLEFLQWSLKQGDRKSRFNNTRSLLKRLSDFATHPSPHKRYGAALGFNFIYTTLREQIEFVDWFMLELAEVFFSSLASADSDEERFGTRDQCCRALDSIVKIISHQKIGTKLCARSTKRRSIYLKPGEITLSRFCESLLQKCGRPETEYRRKCLEFVRNLSEVPELRISEVVREFVRAHIQNRTMVKLAEGEGTQRGGIHRHQVPETPYFGEQRDSYMVSMEWMKSLLAALDCFSSFTVPPFNLQLTEIFEGRASSLSAAISHFVSKIAVIPAEKYLAPDRTQSEINRFRKMKATILISILQFIRMCVRSRIRSKAPLLQDNWGTDLFAAYHKACFEPQTLGFDVSNTETSEKLPQVLISFAQECRKHLDPSRFSKLESFVDSETSKNYQLPNFLSLETNNHSETENILRGYIILLNASFISSQNPKWNIGPKVWVQLTKSITESLRDKSIILKNLSPEVEKSVELSVKLALQLGATPHSIVSSLVDQTLCSLSEERHRKVGLGQMILLRLGGQIIEKFAQDPGPWVKEITAPDFALQRCELLVSFLDRVGKMKKVRTKFGTKVATEILNAWPNICETFSEVSGGIELLIQLLQKLLLLDAKALIQSNNRNPNYRAVFKFFLSQLTEPDKKTCPLRIKNKALSLLGVFAASVGTGTDDEKELQNAVGFLCTHHLPFRSTEFEPGSAEFLEYLTTLRKLFISLSISHSPAILEVLTQIICREQQHVAEAEISSNLHDYAMRLQPNEALTMIKKLAEIFLDGSGDLPAQLRKNTLEKVLLPILKGIPAPTLSSFFSIYLIKIVAPVERLLTKDTEEELTLRIGCFKLLELMYSRISVHILKGSLNQQFSTADASKNLQRTISKQAKDARVMGKDENHQLKLEYRCAAHNCLVALIVATQNDPKFYKLIFQQEVWSLISDRYKPLEFPEQYEHAPLKKRQLVQIGQDAKAVDKSGPPGRENQASLHFLSSHFLSQSSLSAEVEIHDFTKASTDSENSVKKEDESVPDTEASVTIDEVIIEDDDLNRNPCLVTMLAAVKKVALLSQKDPISSKDLPDWMTWLKSQFEDSFGSTEIGKIFIARIITILEDVFKPFAKFWIPALANLVIENSPNFGGSTLHQFRVDLIVVMMGWASSAIPENDAAGKETATSLFNYLLAQVAKSSRLVLKRNLSLLNCLCQCWKDCICPNRSTWKILGEISPEINENEHTIRVQLFGVLLQNNLSPFEETEKLSLIPKLSLQLCRDLNKASIKTYKPSSEVLGLVLQNVSSSGGDVNGLIEGLSLVEAVGILRIEKFADCAHAIQRHYPPFAGRILPKALLHLSAAKGSSLKKIIDILGTACSYSKGVGNDDPYTTLRSVNNGEVFERIFSTQDEELLVSSLQFIEKTVNKRKASELIEIAEKLGRFVEHPSLTCRMAVVRAAIALYAVVSRNEGMAAVIPKIKIILLQLLCDNNLTIRQKIYNFWSHETHLGSASTDRVTALLRDAYCPESEIRFLAYACYLLFERCSESPDFERPVFQQGPLRQCDFENLRIDINWRHRNASIGTPLFAESQSSLPDFMTGSQRAAPGDLIATQAKSALFSQTQKAGLFDWVSGDTLPDTFDSNLSSKSQLDTVLPAQRYRRNQSSFVQPSGAENFDDTESMADLKRLRQRVIRDRASSSRYFAAAEARKKAARRELGRVRAESKEQRVRLFRSYRRGDYPDIEIPHKDILKSLQALAQHDSQIASTLFRSLLSGLSKTFSGELWTKVTDAINDIMETSRFGPLVSSLLVFLATSAPDSGLHGVDPTAVASAAINSSEQHAGIQLIERLVFAVQKVGGVEGEEPVLKRSRTDGDSCEEKTVWIHLLRLHRSLGQFDTVRSILEEKINQQTNEDLRSGLKAESESSYHDAYVFYNSALGKLSLSSTENQDVEVDFLSEARLRCLDLLGQWGSLTPVAIQHLSDSNPPDVEDFWKDDSGDLVEFLSYAVRGAVKERIQSLLSDNIVCASSEKLLSSIRDRKWGKASERRILLERECGADLALLAVMDGNWDEAENYLLKHLDYFIHDWGTLNKTSRELRQENLGKSQWIHEFASGLAAAREGSSEKVESLLRSWETNPFPDDLSSYYDVSTGRILIISAMNKNETGKLHKLDHLRIKFSLRSALHLSKNKHFSLAKEELKIVDRLLQKDTEEGSGAENTWIAGLIEARIAEESQSFNQAKKIILPSLKTLGDMISPLCKMEFLSVQGKLIDALLKKLEVSVHQTGPTSIGALFGSSGLDFILKKNKIPSDSNVGSSLQIIGASCFKEALDHDGNDLAWNRSEIGDPRISLIDFCDRVLRDENHQDPSSLQYAQIFVEEVLKAMKLGSQEARKRFCRVLPVLESEPGAIADFEKNVSAVPSWQFLGWLNQLISMVPSVSVGSTVQKIVLTIAKDYPQALLFPFRIFKDTINEKDSRRLKGFTGKIVQELEGYSSTIDLMVEAFQLLAQPKAILTDAMTELQAILTSKNQKKALEFVQTLRKELFFCGDDGKEILQVPVGEYWIQFRKAYLPFFNENFGKDGDQSTKHDLKSIKAAFNNVYYKIANSTTVVIRGASELKHFSPWLTRDFTQESKGMLYDLEIPGQYDGNCKPIVEEHARIVTIENRITIMSSIQSPKLLRIRGNDGRTYKYLAKAGEDLRQDARIEQVFGVMNEVLSSDKETRTRELHLQTYSVVPMTTRVGLIQFLEDVEGFKEFISNAATPTEENVRNKLKVFHKFYVGPKVVRLVEGSNNQADYISSFKKVSSAAARQALLQAEKSIPPSILKRGLSSISAEPQLYIAVRDEFTRSMGAISASHYLLGIGDRHLSNLMINIKSGTGVGIDFGHAFGTATQFLPVPELVPFRLTPQITHVFEPVGVYGKLGPMIRHTLRALRAEKQLLINVMDVFVKEPSLDWKAHAQRQQTESVLPPQASDDPEWFPKEKIRIATAKLDGQNPVLIFE